MLTVVRRGSASITKLLLIPSTSSPCVKSFISRSYRQHATQTPSPHLIRFLSTAPQWKQRNALANEELEDEIVESQIEQKIQSQPPPSDSQTDEAAHHGPVTKFQGLLDRKLVCETVVKTITDVMRLETMTQVQSMTINETLKGIDVIAQARTGTGKTLAFLIPVLQNIISRDPSLEHHKGWGNSKKTTPMDIRAIIISPTRELAEQIAVEANKLVRNTGVIVQTAVGGSAKQFGLRKIEKEGCHVLVGTPGRLNDILSDPYSRVRAPNLSALVLDEADRLLDQGFSLEIAAIQKNLPQRSEVDRQTLLFSATVPQEVMQMVRSTMKRDFKFVRTVQEGELQTHQKVPQKVVNIRSFENLMPALLELCKRKIAEADELPFKAIVYFGATAEVTLAASIFRNLKNPGASAFHQHPLSPAKIIEIHAKLTQAQRTHAADDFRRSKSGILFSSDVTARGMDFPNVTHVIQIGIPANRDTYIHRLGRTARGDKPGEGWLFATPVDGNVVRERLNNLPLEVDRSLDTGTVDMTKDAQLPEDVATTLTQVVDATKMVPFSEKRAAYVACLGVYQWVQNKQNLINLLNSRSTYGWGAHTPPAVSPLLVRKLGLGRVEGINIGRPEDSSGQGGGGDRFGSSRGDYGGSSRGGFDRSSRGGYGGSSRGSHGGFSRSNYGDSSRGGSSRGSFGDSPRSNYGDSSRGGSSRGSYGESSRSTYGGSSRGGYGDVGESSERSPRSYGSGDRSGGSGGYQRREFGERGSYGSGDRGSSRGRGGYGGDREQRTSRVSHDDGD